MNIFDNPDKAADLELELAALIDAGAPFVSATYYLEEDGLLVFSCYQRLFTVAHSVVPGLPGWRLGVWLITTSWKKSLITETKIQEIAIHNFGGGKTCRTPNDQYIRWETSTLMSAGESLRESNTLNKSLSGPKKGFRFGSWNVKTMFRTGKTAQVSREARRYKIGILGISECRWNGFGRLRTNDGDTIIYSGREEDDAHSSGVAILIRKKEAASLESWAPVSDRIIKARFFSKYIKTTVIQVYAPTNDAEEDTKDAFYEQLQAVVEETPSHDMLILLGDFNAKVGRPGLGEEAVVGPYGLHHERIDNGERLVSLCMTYNLSILTTTFMHKEIHKHTWTSPDGKYHNQIDHIVVSRRFRTSVSS